MKTKALITIAKIAPENGVLPEWYPLYPPGWNQLASGERFLVDPPAFAEVMASWRNAGRDVVIDYEHQTLGDGPAPAAGWIRDLRWDDVRGIEAKIEWTDKARAYLIAGEYRYYSPVSLYRLSDSRLVDIHSVALTNSPKTLNIQPLVAKLELQTPKQEDNEMIKKLIAKFKLAEDATEDQVMEAVDAVIAKAEAGPRVKEVVAKDVLTTLELTDGSDVSTVVASIEALKQTPKGMVSRQEHEALKTRIAEKDAGDAVAAAIASGKITPDQKDWAKEYATRDLAGFGLFVAKAPVVVPVTDLPGKKPENPAAAIDDTVMSIAKMFGNSKEDLQKYAGGA